MKTVTNEDLLAVLDFAQSRALQKAHEYQRGDHSTGPNVADMVKHYTKISQDAGRAWAELQKIPDVLPIFLINQLPEKKGGAQ